MAYVHSPRTVTDGLVFFYDTGNRKSYVGEPATNIWTSGHPNGHGSELEIIYTDYLLGKKINSGVVYRNRVSNPAQSNTSTYYNNGGLNKGSMGFQNLNPSTRYIQISFDYYGVTPYVRHSNPGYGLNGYLSVTYTDSTNVGYGWDTTYSPGSGDDWNNDAARMGYWQKISLIVALDPSKTPSNITAFYLYYDALMYGEGYFANMIFTEHTTYPTGPVPHTTGTRSATQGLLDLTGNSAIDISNVSFDSNAQITFDGSDDWMNAAVTLNAGNFTYETVMKQFGSTSYRIFAAGTGDPSNGGTNIQAFVNSSGGLVNLYAPVGGSGWQYGTYDNTGNFTATSNVNYHIAVVNLDTTWKIYVNGDLVGDIDSFVPTVGNRVGIARSAMQAANDSSLQVSLVKIYDKALTASEVISNYNAVKSRFGI